MGLRDAEEMLEAAKADAIEMERTIADQARQLQEQAALLFQAGEQHGVLWRERHDLEQQIERLRSLVREWQDAGLAGFPEEVLAIVGAQPAPSGDEHDRTA